LRAELADRYEAPRTAVETALARIWRELLGVERVGIHDSFFELGGHSLLATLVVSRTRDALGAEVELRAVMEKPTIGELGAVVEEALRTGRATALPPIRIVDR
jgi:acyl carrier protein